MFARLHSLIPGLFTLLALTIGTFDSELSAQSAKFTEAEKSHWAFQPVRRNPIPVIEMAKGSSPANPVDAFLLFKLLNAKSNFSDPADKLTLIRRVTMDLIGLPPSPDEAAEFVADQSPDAFDKLIDRLLVSPHYGETWGRMWLDVVRFAETAGFNADPARPLAYTYRDYVIRAFNRGLPYDRFLQDQIAGDELSPEDTQSLAATAYCRMWADESNASNIHLARQLALNDLTSNLGAAALGLSIGCAQCHDHKFDPLLQTDFYQLQAFFSGIVLEDRIPVGSHAQLANYRARSREWLEQTADLRRELHAIEREARIKMAGDRRMKFPQDVLAAIDCLPEERTTMQRQLAFWSERQMEYKNDELPKHLSDEQKSRREELLQQLSEAKKSQPKPPREANLMAIAELSTVPPATFLLDSGSYDKPLEEVAPDYPAILRKANDQGLRFSPPNDRSSGRRSELARWLTSAEHPLTYRVWVNRIWQGHFGKGLVDNANDFGVLTPPPSNPELLDWLTSEFVNSGYDTKKLHRLLISSSAFRQRGAVAATGAEKPTESLLACFPRQRLTSERIRDSLLSVAGTLNDTMYGPGVRPELPPNFAGAGNWKVSDAPDRTRRSVYIYAKRNLPYPLMAAFDFPDMHETCGCRTKTTIAPQALMLLNNEIVLKAARQMSDRTRVEAESADPDSRVSLAWKIAFGRLPNRQEVASAREFIARQQQVIANSDSTRSGEGANAPNDSDAEEAFVDLCHSLLNANEFLFIE